MSRFKHWELALIAAFTTAASIVVAQEPKAIVFICGLAGLLAVLVAARSVLTASLFAILSVGGASVSTLTGTSSGATLLRLTVFTCVCLMGVAMKFRRPPIPALAVVVVFSAWGAVRTVLPGSVDRSPLDWAESTIGYIVPWLLLAFDWRNISTRFVVTVIAAAPMFAALVGLGLDVANIASMFNADAIGTVRFAGALPAAYMGSLACFGMISSMWLWIRREAPGLLLLILNGVILASTLARGPLLVASLVVLALVLFTKRARSRIVYIVRFVFISLFTVGVVITLPRILARTRGQDDYQGGLSGRELAWDYFWQRYLDKPLFGHGPGAHSILSQQSTVTLVREYFVTPHNTYLQLLVDFGAIGAAIIVALIICLFIMVARYQRATERVLLVSLGLALGIYAYFDNVLAVPQIYIPAFTLIGLLSAGGKQGLRPAPPEREITVPHKVALPVDIRQEGRIRAGA